MLKRILSVWISASLAFVTACVYAQPVQQLFHDTNSPVGGNPRGKVTIVEFYDYQCGYCVKMAPIVNAIAHSNPNVRIVYKVLPIRGEMSDYAGRAVLAANHYGKFDALNKRLFNMAPNFSEQNIAEAAKDVGLKPATLVKTMQTPAVTRQIKNNYHLAQQLNLSGTPVFFIGPTNATQANQVEVYYGALSSSELQEAIRKAS